jgi:aminomethyltransferase
MDWIDEQARAARVVRAPRLHCRDVSRDSTCDDSPGSVTAVTDHEPRRSPLHAEHEALDARFAEFGGWLMPLQYRGVVEEHTAVRERVGLFDVSHLGTVEVAGPGTTSALNACLSNDLDRIGAGQAQYTLACDDATGGVVDDLIVYRRSDEHCTLVPNAANAAEVVRRLRAALPDEVVVTDRHTEVAILAVQGPSSDTLLDRLGLTALAGSPAMTFQDAFMAPSAPPRRIPVTVCRTGYTGERGVELLVPAADAPAVWTTLLAAGDDLGLSPCGLAARDTLRTEMGYPLHGQDLSLAITPVQARLGWAVGWSKAQFWGRVPLLAERAAGPRRRLLGLRADGRAIPRPGMTVTAGGRACGSVTSGTFSPTLRVGIGLALLDDPLGPGDAVEVDVRGRPAAFAVVKPPFVPART